jgi:heme exporter protein D
MDLGPHAVFIWGSYAAVALALAGLIAWLLLDGRRLKRTLAELDARGLRRRSDPRSVEASSRQD